MRSRSRTTEVSLLATKNCVTGLKAKVNHPVFWRVFLEVLVNLLTAWREPMAFIQPESGITNIGLFRRPTHSDSKLVLGYGDPRGSVSPEGVGVGSPTAM